MNAEALAKLAEIGHELGGPEGGTFEEFQAEQDETLAALKERLQVAFGKIQRAEAKLAEASIDDCDRTGPLGWQLDAAADAWQDLVTRFENSADPEAFVMQIEYEAGEAEQEVVDIGE